jgi:hypothetical protein
MREVLRAGASKPIDVVGDLEPQRMLETFKFPVTCRLTPDGGSRRNQRIQFTARRNSDAITVRSRNDA